MTRNKDYIIEIYGFLVSIQEDEFGRWRWQIRKLNQQTGFVFPDAQEAESAAFSFIEEDVNP